MTTAQTYDSAPAWVPRTRHAPGEVLWGAPPRRQPILPLLGLALLTLLVAAPAAMSSSGQSSNPITLLHAIAETTYEISGLMETANGSLEKIDRNSRPLRELQVKMGAIATSSAGMKEKTVALDQKLGGVGASVSQSRSALKVVDTKLTATAQTMGGLRGSVGGSLDSTRTIVREFRQIDTSIGAMDGNLRSTIGLMAVSTPQTKAFAENRTRVAIAGGDGRKYGVPNISAGNRVMSVMLPMITTMQKGGPMAARKDSAQASNILVGTLLKRQVPDGTNVIAHVQPFDGFYGLPAPEYFVATRVNGL